VLKAAHDSRASPSPMSRRMGGARIASWATTVPSWTGSTGGSVLGRVSKVGVSREKLRAWDEET
jgi:hypothetical protein